MAGSVPTGLNTWLQRIRDAEMPIFGRTAVRVRELTDSDSAAVSELSQVILEDPGMTAKLLRIANSAIFNASGQHVLTVSRTVLLLGFNLVRDVALTVAFVDSFLRGSPRERARREIGRSFHAAAQARWIAQRRHDLLPEEVFIAALLYRLGEIAFWCFSGEAGDGLDHALGQSLRPPGEVEKRLLGFRLHHLTDSLVREWHISPLLQSVLKGAYTRRSREQGVIIAYRLAEALEGGWRCERAKLALRELADYLQLPLAEIEPHVAANAAQAARVAEEFGAAAVAHYIPSRPGGGEADSPAASPDDPAPAGD